MVIAETSQAGALTDSTHELLGAARQLASQTGGQAVVVFLGLDVGPHAEGSTAADRIIATVDKQLAYYTPEAYVSVLGGIIEKEGPRAVLVGSTAIGIDLAPSLGARLGAPVVTGCKTVTTDGDLLKVTAIFCGGKMLADIDVTGRPAILQILPGSYEPVEPAGETEVNTVSSPVPLEPGAISFEQMVSPETDDVDITQEDVLVAVGRGIEQEDNVEVAEELAKALGGQLCASRPIVDRGWLPTTRQVGKSGIIVKPKLYIALGISGAPEHLEGMTGSGLTIAVNTDPAAPIFAAAQYGTTVDLLDLAPDLIEAIKAKKQ
jgi:electron transfer flavoprotein alpha subunit